MSVVSIRESLGIGIFENFTAESIAKDAEGPWHLTQTPEPQRSLRKALRSQRNSVHADELSVDHPSGGTIKSKEPAVGLFQSKLPPRSTAGQLTLDQHIGVRIPGGQPNLFNHLRSSEASKTPPGNIQLVTFASRTRRTTWECRCRDRNPRDGKRSVILSRLESFSESPASDSGRVECESCRLTDGLICKKQIT